MHNPYGINNQLVTWHLESTRGLMELKIADGKLWERTEYQTNLLSNTRLWDKEDICWMRQRPQWMNIDISDKSLNLQKLTATIDHIDRHKGKT
jgi:hypothetical protein